MVFQPSPYLCAAVSCLQRLSQWLPLLIFTRTLWNFQGKVLIQMRKQLHNSGQDTGEETSEENIFAVWPFSTHRDVISWFQTPAPLCHPVPLRYSEDFPGGPVVKTLCFQAGGSGSIPSHRTKILHAEPCSQKKNKHLGIDTDVFQPHQAPQPSHQFLLLIQTSVSYTSPLSWFCSEKIPLSGQWPFPKQLIFFSMKGNNLQK